MSVARSLGCLMVPDPRWRPFMLRHWRGSGLASGSVLRPELMTVAEALLALEVEVLSLDHIGAALGAMRVTPDEIDELLHWLERHGRPIGDPPEQGAAALLTEVLSIARRLRAELGRPPQPREIAERGALSIEAVQRALWFARVLQR